MNNTGYKISKEEYTAQSKLHAVYLAKKDYQFELPIEFFSAAEAMEIQKNGEWYQALENSVVKPITSAQHSFIYNLRNLNLEYTGNGAVWIKYQFLYNQWGDIYKILSQADNDELTILTEILKIKSGTPNDIITRLQSLGSNVIGKFDHHIIKVKNVISYRGILLKALKKLNVESDASNKELEYNITVKVLEDALNKMTPEQRKKFEAEIKKMAKENGSNLYSTGISIAVLTSAKLSGFGIYILATTALSSFGGALGLTLSFAAYTTLTSAISVILGPLGWVSLGLYATWRIFDVNYKKIIPAIIYLHWLREKYLKNVIYLPENANSQPGI